ncbi:MAG TPA: hypothetical protein VFG47_19910 [Geminicoccaceae bacterium]|nr:hypothetical protein [Geminicoccaceae bacterium]
MPTIRELAARLERLEREVLRPPLIFCTRRGVPGLEPHMTVSYRPGIEAPRPLKPGELEWLRRRFGAALVIPVTPTIGGRPPLPLVNAGEGADAA